MSTEENKAVVRRWFEALNRGDLRAAFETIDPNIVDHEIPPGSPPGIEGVRQMFTTSFAAFPDMHITIDDMIAEGDRVVTRITARGTHQGEFMGMPPTGKQITLTSFDIVRVVGGKQVEHWGQMDMMGLMQQLGVMPAPSRAGG